jgi:flagellar biosynthesis protein FlhG
MVETIAIASGKGGVGKTSLAVNCAIELSAQKNLVGLLDADFGLANAHIMLDQKVNSSIIDLLDGKSSIADLVHVTPSGVKLIPGGSGVLDIMNIDSKKRWEVIKSVGYLRNDLDFLFVDTPAGASDSSIEFAAACDKIIIVLVGEPTSFMDAYAFIKALSIEKNIDSVSIVVNMANDAADALNSYNSFQKIVLKFLSIELKFVGWLPQSKAISNSIVARKPFVLNKKANGNLALCIADILKKVKEAGTVKSNSIKFFEK